MSRGSKAAIKTVLFIILVFVGWNIFDNDYVVELHELGHMNAYAQDGIRSWRIDKYHVGSQRYSFDGIMGGHRTVFRAMLLVYGVLFFLTFNQFWILGPLMGLMARAIHHPWEGGDFTKIARWTDRMFSTWFAEDMLWFGLAILAFIALKLIPEYYKAATGKKIESNPEKNHPYIKEPTALP